MWRMIRSKLAVDSATSVTDGLKKLYNHNLKPLEITYRFDEFVSPLLTDSEFDAKPMVMLLGQYSTGKTTFIKHLLGTSYPGAHIGPQPTTDGFVAVMNGPTEISVPGSACTVRDDMPFKGLTRFGTSFLSKFQCSQMPHPFLENITLVDTPGVLSGEKQRTDRSYDFTGVTSWFAAKSDIILLLFDPHKLDISDELKRVIESLQGHEDKIRVVLNKADQVDMQQLMRVYGALMWSLGKVFHTPEAIRVYIGSFNNESVSGRISKALLDKELDGNQTLLPIFRSDNDLVKETAFDTTGKLLFEKEQGDLLADLADIPKKSCDRRLNEFVKRARAAKIHAHIISHLKREMPSLFGKAAAQQRLINTLPEEFAKLQVALNLPPGDFPNVERFREILTSYRIDDFERFKPHMIDSVNEMLDCNLPKLLNKFHNPDHVVEV